MRYGPFTSRRCMRPSHAPSKRPLVRTPSFCPPSGCGHGTTDSACWGLCAGSHGGDRGRRNRAGRSTDPSLTPSTSSGEFSAPTVPAEESRFQKRFGRNGAEDRQREIRESPSPTAPRQAKTAGVASAPQSQAQTQHHAQGTAFQSFNVIYEDLPSRRASNMRRLRPVCETAGNLVESRGRLSVAHRSSCYARCCSDRVTTAGPF